MSIHGPKRKAKQLDVPTIDDDPAERKRLLNVLAQRRYRRRKKEHIQKLEHSVARSSTSDSTESPQSIPTPPAPSPQRTAYPFHDVAFDSLDDNLVADPTTDSTYFPIRTDTPSKDTSFFEPAYLDPRALAAFDATFGSFTLPSLPPSPSLSGSDHSLGHLRSPSRPLSRSSINSLSRDEAHLPMLELNLMRGAVAIAQRLEVHDLIWSLDSQSPFYHASSQTSWSHLPVNLRPTQVQLRNPHHPIFDILPWPSVRDKLILVFSQNPEIRPPTARSPFAMLDLVYDIEDPAEGVRIWGDDPYRDDNWEVGEKLFKNWWWCLNSEIITRANELRKERGAKLLGVQRIVEELE